MFDAQYKGNSTTESIGDPVTAELVWQDAKNLIQDIYYVSKEKKIVAVTAPGTSIGVKTKRLITSSGK